MLLAPLVASAAAPLPPPRLFADLCLRLERFEDGRFSRAADALTLSARAGAEFSFAPGLALLAELEGAATLAGTFDDGRGRPAGRPRIPDPPNAELNRLVLAASVTPGWQLDLGRQYVVDSRQRYFGRSGWRQNRQSFDALRLEGKLGETLHLELAYLDRVWRPAGRFHPDAGQRSQRLDAWLGSLRLGLPAGSLEGFLHAVEGGDASVLRHRNQGLRWRAESAFWPFERVDILLEAARQQEQRRSGWLAYRAGELGIEGGSLRFLLGFEYEGGDGDRAFQTPFGSGHSFNGWADRFGATPPDGLLDRYLALSGEHALGAGGAWVLRRHVFRATRGKARYGSEWNGELTFRLRPGLLRLKLADHQGALPEQDLAKLWLAFEFESRTGR
jgi:hypothetical protein